MNRHIPGPHRVSRYAAIGEIPAPQGLQLHRGRTHTARPDWPMIAQRIGIGLAAGAALGELLKIVIRVLAH